MAGFFDNFGFGDVLGPAMSLAGGFLKNRVEADQADENRNWQQYMSGTAHQREVADLEAAGLNPMLSVRYGGSGATSSPPGAMAQMSDPITPAVSTAREYQLLKAEVDLKKAQAENERASAKLKSGPAELSGAVAGYVAPARGWIEDKARELAGLVASVVAPGREATGSAFEAFDRGRNKASMAFGDFLDDLKEKVEAIKATPRKVQNAITSTAKEARDRWGTSDLRPGDIIPPGRRGEQRGGMRGKLGGANTWDYRGGSSR